MKRLLLFLCFLPVICFGQYRADRARTNPNVSDGNGYCFRGHTATAVSAYCPEALALFARMTTQPTDARKTVINTFITSLKTAGVWDKLDAMYVFAAANQQAALLNWIADTNNATAENSPAFTADEGIQGNGTNSYDNTFTNCTGGYGINFNSFYTNDYKQYDNILKDNTFTNATVVINNQVRFTNEGNTITP